MEYNPKQLGWDSEFQHNIQVDPWEENYMSIRESTKDGETNSDCRIKVSSRDMTNSINHDHNNQTPCHTYAWKCDHPINLVHNNWSTASKYHKKRTNDFCNELQINFKE